MIEGWRAFKISIGKPTGKMFLERLRHRWKDYIYIYTYTYTYVVY